MANIFEREADRFRKIIEFVKKHDCCVIIPLQSKRNNESDISQILNEDKSFNQSLIGPIKVNNNPTKYRIFV